MSSITDFLIQIGSAVAVALWASARLLKAVLVPAIRRTQSSGDLRYIIHRVVIVALVMLAVAVIVALLAYMIVSADSGKRTDVERHGPLAPPPIATPAPTTDEFRGNSPGNSDRDTQLPGLHSPPARIVTSETSNRE